MNGTGPPLADPQYGATYRAQPHPNPTVNRPGSPEPLLSAMTYYSIHMYDYTGCNSTAMRRLREIYLYLCDASHGRVYVHVVPRLFRTTRLHMRSSNFGRDPSKFSFKFYREYRMKTIKINLNNYYNNYNLRRAKQD